MRRIALAATTALVLLAAARAQDAPPTPEWKAPESNEVRDKAVAALVAALERAKADGATISTTGARTLVWFGPYGCSPAAMDEETIAAIQSAGVSHEEVAWTGERLLEAMKLLYIKKTPVSVFEKQERELFQELTRRATAAKAALPKDSAWSKGVDALMKLEEKTTEKLRGAEGPKPDAGPALEQIRMATINRVSVAARLQTLRSAANELEAVPLRGLDLLDELEDARNAHSEATNLLERAVLHDSKKDLEALPKKNVEAAEKHGPKLHELSVALGWTPFVPKIAPFQVSNPPLEEKGLAGFVKFLESLARAKYSLADAPPHGALSAVDLSPLDAGNERDDAAVEASGIGRPELVAAGNRAMELVVAIVTARTSLEEWQKRIDAAKADIDKAREEADKAHPNPERAQLTKAHLEVAERRKVAMEKLRVAYQKELVEAAKAFESPDNGVGTPADGSWGEVLKADRECLEALFSGMTADMDYWSYVGERRTGRGCPPAERKALSALHAHAERRAMLEVFARAAKQGPTVLARAQESELAFLKAKLPEIEKLLQAMESPLYAK